MLLLLPWLAALAARAPDPLDEQLDEVVVTAAKPQRNPQKVLDWLARLVGQYTFEGNVDSYGRGRPDDLRPVRGQGNCVGFGPAPAVQCEFSVEWSEAHGPDGEELPGGVSTLNPAMMVFAFEPDRIGIRYLLVDSKGIADGAMAPVTGDTLSTRSRCVSVSGNCQRVQQITASPDPQVIEMRIDIELDGRRAARLSFVMRRVAGNTAVVIGVSP